MLVEIDHLNLVAICLARFHPGVHPAVFVPGHIARVFGLSTQDSAYQREAVERLHLPFPVLSDERLALTRALDLPTFTTSGMTLLKRMALIIEEGVIGKDPYDQRR